mmetsp:Transcript_10669/g.35328  ORF Transcript_10669/g.35328 Transcript_10669/m.35328 type:complete len:393 (+) Transcript_10669:1403-2581(+)
MIGCLMRYLRAVREGHKFVRSFVRPSEEGVGLVLGAEGGRVEGGVLEEDGVAVELEAELGDEGVGFSFVVVVEEAELPAERREGGGGSVGSDDLGGGVEAYVVDELVEDEGSHVGHVAVAAEEGGVVAEVEGAPDVEGVGDGGVRPGLGRNVAKDVEQLGVGVASLRRRQPEVVEDPVGEELGGVARHDDARGGAGGARFGDSGVEFLELSLALVVLVHVGVFEGDPRVSFVDVDGEGRLREALHGHVLSNRLELVARPVVVDEAVLPLMFQLGERRRQHSLWSDVRGIRRARQPEVVLLQGLAGPDDDADVVVVAPFRVVPPSQGRRRRRAGLPPLLPGGVVEPLRPGVELGELFPGHAAALTLVGGRLLLRLRPPRRQLLSSPRVRGPVS